MFRSDPRGCLTMAIEEAMDRTGPTHLLEALTKCATPTMQAHGDIVQRCAEACREPVTWLAQDVCAPDDVCIFILERRQQPVEAVANGHVQIRVWFSHTVLQTFRVQLGLATTPPDHISLMIDNRRRKNLAQPAAHSANVTELRCPLQRTQREALKHILRLVMIPKAVLKKVQHFLPRLNYCALNGSVMRLGSAAFPAFVTHSVIVITRHFVLLSSNGSTGAGSQNSLNITHTADAPIFNAD